MADDAAWASPGYGVSWIPSYRVILFNAPGLGFSISEVDAASDNEALRMARALANGRAFELWDALVMLGRYDPPG